MIRLILSIGLLLQLAACWDGGAAPGWQGYVEGEYLRIAAPDGGWVETVAVREGETVAAGAPLFTLDATRERAALAEAQARLAQAEADLADRAYGLRPAEIAALEAQMAEAESALKLARLTADRQRDLARANAAAQARVDAALAERDAAAARVDRMRAELASAKLPARDDRIAAAKAAVEAARAAVAQAEWRLSQRAIASPADALVEELVREAGEWAPAGGPVVSLLPPGAVKVVFFVPEPERAGLSPGAVLPVACDGCPPGLTARVTRMAAEAEYTPPVIYSQETRAKLVFRAEAALDRPGLLPGQPVTVGQGQTGRGAAP